MRVEVELTPLRFDQGFAEHYCPQEWASIIITELQDLNLPMSEEYDMGIQTFGECISQEYGDQLVYLLNQYKDIPQFIEQFNVIMYLFMRALD